MGYLDIRLDLYSHAPSNASTTIHTPPTHSLTRL